MFWHDKLLKKYIRSKGFITSVDLMTDIDLPIRVVLFDTMRHFQKVAAATKSKRSIATFYPPPKSNDDQRCIGMMIFCAEYIGAGIVTHEIFHQAEYLQQLGWESEQIASTLQDLTVNFWNWYYAITSESED